MNDDLIWQTKLAARIHDPAEKALVLLRDPAGHEGGTSRVLTRLLGLSEIGSENDDADKDAVLSLLIFKKGMPPSIYRHVQRADWWAAAADRPQLPMQEIVVTTKTGKQKTFAVAPWAQVRWASNPVLIHPLTGAAFDLREHGGLRDSEIADIKQRSFEHFSRLLVMLGAKEESTQDWRKILLAFWRFGPDLIEEEDFGKLGELWRLLPADTRIPDHSIWDHLDLTSAFAGAFAADPKGEAALLALAIGPVQDFIAAARTTSDLWAGSHLLSRLAWEAMRPICEQLGPDAILFPRLRGIPQVDLWLRDRMNLPDTLFKDCDWMQGGTDANPLFSAALPNRFVAVVPASQAKALAEQVTQAVRAWLGTLGDEVVSRLLKEAGFDVEGTGIPYEQMKTQLAGFPEVHWAVVPFSLIVPRDENRQTDLDTSALSAAMAPFFGVEAGQACGFLDSPAWKILQKGIEWDDNTTFLAPNPGILYPAVYDLAERVLAAAKATRTFDQTRQRGWRCSLTGEAEWLTTDPDQLAIPAGQRRSRKNKGFVEGRHHETLWTKVADEKPSWAKKGEHLSALPAIKRLWPTIFADEVGKALAAGERGEQKAISRFVVSTHTMALAHQLDQWLKQVGHTAEGLDTTGVGSVALPRKLIRQYAGNAKALDHAKRIPALLEATRDAEDENAYDRAQHLVRQVLGVDKLETYYALLMMDGDRMGRILSGDEDTAISYRDSFHPQMRGGFDQHAARQPRILAYGGQKRPTSPNRHLAISGALNDFSQIVARHVIEEEHMGRVVYAGGDDLLAMLPVADLLSAMRRLRHAYSGIDPDHVGGTHAGLTLQNGFAALKTRRGGKERLQLMRMMGSTATASCGAVIAHHQAPLGAVMRELRAAEKRAKNYSRPDEMGKIIDRNAFHLTIIKRSGGSLHLPAEWGEPMVLLGDLRDFLADPDVSRRAVYNTLEWLTDLPDPRDKPEILASLLAYQFERQITPRERGRVREAHRVSELARRLSVLAAAQLVDGLDWLRNFLAVAEFLARETRTGTAE